MFSSFSVDHPIRSLLGMTAPERFVPMLRMSSSGRHATNPSATVFGLTASLVRVSSPLSGHRNPVRDEPHAEHAQRFDDRLEARVSTFRKRFVEPGASHAGLLGKFRHSTVCASGDTDDVSDVRGIVTTLFERCRKICGHILRGLQVVGRIVASTSTTLSCASCHAK
jgi:hypothetical protein